MSLISSLMNHTDKPKVHFQRYNLNSRVIVSFIFVCHRAVDGVVQYLQRATTLQPTAMVQFGYSYTSSWPTPFTIYGITKFNVITTNMITYDIYEASGIFLTSCRLNLIIVAYKVVSFIYFIISQLVKYHIKNIK